MELDELPQGGKLFIPFSNNVLLKGDVLNVFVKVEMNVLTLAFSSHLEVTALVGGGGG